MKIADKKIKNSRSIVSSELETIYRVMLYRIVKGYSASELSFLIGAEAGYVEEIESLFNAFYSDAELERIGLALEEADLETLHDAQCEYGRKNVRVISKICRNKLIHTYCYLDGLVKKRLFRLWENIPVDITGESVCGDDLNTVRNGIGVLVDANFFRDAKLPLEIFHAVNKFLPIRVRPYMIALVLPEYCDEKMYDLSLKITVGDDGVFRYEKS